MESRENGNLETKKIVSRDSTFQATLCQLCEGGGQKRKIYSQNRCRKWGKAIPEKITNRGALGVPQKNCT